MFEMLSKLALVMAVTGPNATVTKAIEGTIIYKQSNILQSSYERTVKDSLDGRNKQL